MSDRNEDDFEIETTSFGVPDAPAPKPRYSEDLPDWAKITSSIVEEESEEEEVESPAAEYVPPMGKFGVSFDELSDEDLFLDEEEPQKEEKPVQPKRAEPVAKTALPKQEVKIEQVSRSIAEAEEEEEEIPVSKPATVSTPIIKMPRAKATNVKPAKQARKVKKAIKDGLVSPETEILAPRGRMAGNRWKLIGLRTAVWGTLGMVVLAGLFAIFGPKGPSLSSVTQQVLSNINRNNFPLEAGQQVASRFAKEYLSFNPNKFGERDAALSEYIIGSGIEEGRIVNFTSSREQRVIGEPILAMPAELVSDNHVVYTFAIQVFQPAVKETEDTPALPATEPTWVYLAVPMAADINGAVGVAGAPAFVPQPSIAQRGDSITFKEDPDAARQSKSQIEKFMLHWAASDEVSMKPYLVDDVSTDSARAGLGDTLEFVSISGYRVEALPEDFVQPEDVAPTCSSPEFEAPCRAAYLEATWNFQGIEVTHKYRLVVLFDGQNWRVIDIKGSNFGQIGG